MGANRPLKLVFEGSPTLSLVEQNLDEHIEARSARPQAECQSSFLLPSIEFQQPANLFSGFERPWEPLHGSIAGRADEVHVSR